MKAIILAAGIGSRIRPLTNNTHKSLLKVGNRTILEMMISNILNSGITEIIVVTSYMNEKLKQVIAGQFHNISFQYVYNKEYLVTNTA